MGLSRVFVVHEIPVVPVIFVVPVVPGMSKIYVARFIPGSVRWVWRGGEAVVQGDQ